MFLLGLVSQPQILAKFFKNIGRIGGYDGFSGVRGGAKPVWSMIQSQVSPKEIHLKPM